MNEAFAEYGFDLTVTLPCSYWYMQNFDIVSMEKYVSWFNGKLLEPGLHHPNTQVTSF
jgi:hypothetical protein